MASRLDYDPIHKDSHADFPDSLPYPPDTRASIFPEKPCIAGDPRFSVASGNVSFEGELDLLSTISHGRGYSLSKYYFPLKN